MNSVNLVVARNGNRPEQIILSKSSVFFIVAEVLFKQLLICIAVQQVEDS